MLSIRLSDEQDIDKINDVECGDGLVQEVDNYRDIKVGDMFQDIGRIILIYVHHESGSLWIYVLDAHGNLWDVDVSDMYYD